MSRKNC